jgi:hypothetical protein
MTANGIFLMNDHLLDGLGEKEMKGRPVFEIP